MGRILALVPLVSLALLACSDAVTAPSQQAEPTVLQARFGESPQAELLTEVMQATALFNSVTQATKHGYLDSGECVAVPVLGGMGVHWLNPGLVDPVFDPLHPEALLYEPGPNGQSRLVGVEYIVVDVGQPAPDFAGRAFDVGGTPLPIAHWNLHVWLWRENPSGMFEAFNPDVTCP